MRLRLSCLFKLLASYEHLLSNSLAIDSRLSHNDSTVYVDLIDLIRLSITSPGCANDRSFTLFELREKLARGNVSASPRAEVRLHDLFLHALDLLDVVFLHVFAHVDQ